MIDFETDPSRYRHWRLDVEAPIAYLTLNVKEDGGLVPGYELKMNSYDLSVDIELHDAVQRLRFEHPGVKAVVIRSGQERVFCAGANIRMLSQSSHAHKVNFCKFTNETRNAIEEAGASSGQRYIAAVSGSAAGGGYELALAADHIMLIDDRSSSVSFPETPVLAVLPGTGGLTRVVDKRKVRRDLADIFSTLEEGVRGKRAVEWRLVDEVVPKSAWEQSVKKRALELAAKSDRPGVEGAEGVRLGRLSREFSPSGVAYAHVHITIDRERRIAELTVHGPTDPPPPDGDTAVKQGSAFWPLAMARELDDAILHLRFNEPELGLIVLRTTGDGGRATEYDALLETARDHWFIREVRHYLKRVLKRLDLTSRSIIALIEPGSCFAGTLAELAFAADRSAMLEGTYKGESQQPAWLTLTSLNFGAYPMSNGLSRLATRFLGEPASVDRAREQAGVALDSATALGLGLVTVTYDAIDWSDEIRIMLEERASFSPDALTGMEANLRFPGPETMETKIFGRLTAWQNWIFQRPNAAGEEGALRRYGSGQKPAFDRKRV
ncbi:MAG TPA: 2,3-epoxybenzoyl-CoA dihydrolase [Gemmatimonadales bacterium]|nr:2,3-epoxybenzoyl-CoA dihydrolase [Gemmatimonadales bacterium]